MDGEAKDPLGNHRSAAASDDLESGKDGGIVDGTKEVKTGGTAVRMATDEDQNIGNLENNVGGTNSESGDKEKKDMKKEKSPTVSYFRLFSFATPYDYALMFVGFVGAAAHGTALPLLFLFFGKLINGLGSGGPDISPTVNKYVVAFVYIGIVNLVSSWVEVSAWMYTGERQSSRMREEYLKALLKQEIAYFDTHASTGDFVSTISSEPLLVQDAISEKVGTFIHYVCTCIAALIVGFTISWRMSIVTFAALPLIASVGGSYIYSLTRVATKATAAYSEAGKFAEQGTSQVRTVYSFVGEDSFVRSYVRALESTKMLGARLGLAKGLGWGSTYGILFLCWAFLVWYGGSLVRKGEISGGETLAAIFAIIIGSLSLGQAMPNLSAFAKGRAAGYTMLKMIQQEPQIKKDAAGETLESVKGHLELRNVDFSYPSRPDVLIFKQFSLEIPPGKTVAIVGHSGSGKSTIVSLIERFYDPNAGAVLLDGHDLRNLNLKWMRNQIGLVNQEPALFATSILANILYGKEDADKEEVSEAVQAANTKSFIDQLPLGYHTQVGEKGGQLSGGQKQRVAIARAILKNPKILLLDEATSALDSASEQVVQEALERLMVGRTTVVVAHRLSTIRKADTIAVVQEGHIVEMGTHDELISKTDGAYLALVRRQEMATETTVPVSAPISIGPANGGAHVTASGSRRHSLSFRSLRGSLASLSQDRFGSFGSNRFTGSQRFMSSKRRGQSLSLSVDSDNVVVPEFSEEDSKEDSTGQGQGQAQAQPKQVFRRLLAMSKPDWTLVLAGTIGSGLAGGLTPLYAYIIASTLGTYLNTDLGYVKSETTKLSLLLVGMGVVAPFIYSLQHYFLAVAGERLVGRVRERMFTAVLRNEVGWFDRDENNSAQISARLASDATQVRGVIGDRVAIIFQNFIILLIAFVLAFFIQWKMTLVTLVTVPIVVGCSLAEHLFLTGFSGDQSQAHARATRVAAEAVANVRIVAAFNAEHKIQELYATELHAVTKKTLSKGQATGIGFGISQCFLYCSYAFSLWYAGKVVSSGETSPIRAIRVVFLLVVCSFTASETLAMSPDLVKGSQAAKSVFQILDRKTLIEPNDPNGEKPNTILGLIEFKDVHFAYPSRPNISVLKYFNLKVPAGRSMALVGASGSGKSSVVALIERYYDPVSGEVLIDGKDLRSYNLRSIRSHIGLVQQEPALFDTSVMQNILYGREGATEAEVIEAAKTANVHKFVSALPEGYATQVGDRGIQLSGGQKQRVAIARAVLRDPAILLLDEATSALDAESEKVVQEALERLMKGRTCIIVAHRLSTIRNADSIAVLQDGDILETGSHAELMERRGAYARMVKLENRFRQSEHAARLEPYPAASKPEETS